MFAPLCLFLFLWVSFVSQSALTEQDIIEWEGAVSSCSSAQKNESFTPEFKIPKMAWSLEESAQWMKKPAVKKAWGDLFKVLQEIPTPEKNLTATTTYDFHTKQHTVFSKNYGQPVCWYLGATVATGKTWVTSSHFIQSVLNNGTLLRGLEASENPVFRKIIQELKSK